MTKALPIRASEVVDELVANGADIRFRPSEGSLPASFFYELRAGGDRQRCRRIIVATKGDTALWRAVVENIGERFRIVKIGGSP